MEKDNFNNGLGRCTNESIHGAANTVYGNIKWIESQAINIIVFGLNNLLAISDAENKSIICTLPGHKGRVNAVEYLSINESIYIITGAEDSTVRVWNIRHSNELNLASDWKCLEILSGWDASIISVSYKEHDGIQIIIGADCNGNVLTWAAKHGNSFVKIDSFKLPPSQLPRVIQSMVYKDKSEEVSSEFLLFIGAVDSKIHIKVANTKDFIVRVESGGLNSDKLYQNVGSLIGHEEWITGFDVLSVTNNNEAGFLLASSSQDSKIRLWKFNCKRDHTISFNANANNDIVEDVEEDELLDAQDGAVVLIADEIMTEARLSFQTANYSWSVYLDALIVGHEDWVTSIHFILGDETNKLRLFSTSMDRNFIIWSPDERGIWVPMTRMGDIGGTLGGSVGQNLLGFVDGTLNEKGNRLLGIGYGGSFHLWKKIDNENRWNPEFYHTGHFSSVNDITWNTSDIGCYLVSVSSDQTCRIFGKSAFNNWVEIARPQIHGYDLNCVVLGDSHFLFTGGDEKLIRVFDAPQIFFEGLIKLCHQQEFNKLEESKIYKAYIPELGLSNKASDLMTNQELKEIESRGIVPIEWSKPPGEGQLADHTVWPEMKKLFGHVNEIICMDISSDRLMLASACKSRDSQSATIIIRDIQKLVIVSELPGHESTIVRLKFSHNNRFLASVGKDRSLVLFMKSKDSSQFIFSEIKKSIHKRIIWDCCWLELSVNELILLTVSRDGICKIWLILDKGDEEKFEIILKHSFIPFEGTSITSIDAIPKYPQSNEYILSLGSESGQIQIWTIDTRNILESIKMIIQVPQYWAHCSTVKRLKWRNVPNTTDEISRQCFQLASCGEDTTVRIFNIVTS